MAFDVLALDGKDLRDRPLTKRKRILARVMPRVEPRVRLVKGVEARGVEFFRVACQHDLEGIVAKWKGGTYTSGPRTVLVEDPESELFAVGEPARAV